MEVNLNKMAFIMFLNFLLEQLIEISADSGITFQPSFDYFRYSNLVPYTFAKEIDTARAASVKCKRNLSGQSGGYAEVGLGRYITK